MTDDPQGAVPTVADFATKILSLGTMELPDETPVDSALALEDALRRHQTWVESVVVPTAPVAGRRLCLRGADLRGLNLVRRELRAADLSRANLEGAALQGANLTLACLNGANLRNANLRGAKLRLADLTGAVLEGADLAGAVLE